MLIVLASPELNLATIILFVSIIIMYEAQQLMYEKLIKNMKQLQDVLKTQTNTIALQNEIQMIQGENITGLCDGLGIVSPSQVLRKSNTVH